MAAAARQFVIILQHTIGYPDMARPPPVANAVPQSVNSNSMRNKLVKINRSWQLKDSEWWWAGGWGGGRRRRSRQLANKIVKQSDNGKWNFNSIWMCRVCLPLAGFLSSAPSLSLSLSINTGILRARTVEVEVLFLSLCVCVCVYFYAISQISLFSLCSILWRRRHFV